VGFNKIFKSAIITSGWLPWKCLGPDVAKFNCFYLKKWRKSLLFIETTNVFVFGVLFCEKKIAQKQNTDITNLFISETQNRLLRPKFPFSSLQHRPT
jgi:hypothetical protein